MQKVERMSVVESVSAEVVRGIPEIVGKLIGTYRVEQWRDGKMIDVREGKNLVVTAGKNSMLDIMFHGSTQITTWYFGLVDNASFSTFALADTMSSHSGWIENVDYSESVRQTWDEAAASAGSTTSSTVATFTINANSKTIHGIFVTSSNTKSGTTGTLWSGVAFGSNLAVNSGDLIKVTYSVTLT